MSRGRALKISFGREQNGIEGHLAYDPIRKKFYARVIRTVTSDIQAKFNHRENALQWLKSEGVKNVMIRP